MTRRLLALALTATLALGSTSLALTDEEFAELTGRQVTLDVTIAVQRFDSLGPVWTAPYAAIDEFLDTVEAAAARVEAVTFPECLHVYRDTLLLGLRLLHQSIEVVGEAAGVADDEDRAAFSAYGPAGYVLLAETAPNLLAVADCGQTLPEDVT